MTSMNEAEMTPAGIAKENIPIMHVKHAITLPPAVTGGISPYPSVVIVSHVLEERRRGRGRSV